MERRRRKKRAVMMKMSDLRHRRMKEVFSFLLFSTHCVCVCVLYCVWPCGRSEKWQKAEVLVSILSPDGGCQHRGSWPQSLSLLSSIFDEGVPKVVCTYTSWNELQFSSMISWIYPSGLPFFLPLFPVSPFLHFPFFPFLYLYLFFLASSGRSWRKMLESRRPWRDWRTLRESTRYDCDRVLSATQPWFIIILLTIHDMLRWSMLVLEQQQQKSGWNLLFFLSPFPFFLHLFILFIVFLYIQVPSG